MEMPDMVLDFSRGDNTLYQLVTAAKSSGDLTVDINILPLLENQAPANAADWSRL